MKKFTLFYKQNTVEVEIVRPDALNLVMWRRNEHGTFTRKSTASDLSPDLAAQAAHELNPFIPAYQIKRDIVRYMRFA